MPYVSFFLHSAVRPAVRPNQCTSCGPGVICSDHYWTVPRWRIFCVLYFESKHSEMDPVRQNPIQRTVRAVHMCHMCAVQFTVYNYCTQYCKIAPAKWKIPTWEFLHALHRACKNSQVGIFHLAGAILQYCVQQLYTVNCTAHIWHIWTARTVLWIGFCLTGSISLCLDSFLWPPYVIGQAIIFLPCGFFFLYLFFLA